jgi:catechol 2,3-dioxygenase-like lactoylglutathione lyase family enzyme
VPTADQDEAIAFYRDKLGFTLVADVPFGDGYRWVEMAPPGGGANVAFGPTRNDFQPGRPTGILLTSPDPAADRAELAGVGVDVDADVMGGDGGVPVMFSFRDQDKNQLMIVQEG